MHQNFCGVRRPEPERDPAIGSNFRGYGALSQGGLAVSRTSRSDKE